MKIQYFDQDAADEDDFILKSAIQQGYVPKTCLLGGSLLMIIVNQGQDPCVGCNCNRSKCFGRPKEGSK